MYKVKFSNGEIITFISKDKILQYVSKNWGVQKYQIIIKDKRISLVGKFGSMFAIVGKIE